VNGEEIVDFFSKMIKKITARVREFLQSATRHGRRQSAQPTLGVCCAGSAIFSFFPVRTDFQLSFLANSGFSVDEFGKSEVCTPETNNYLGAFNYEDTEDDSVSGRLDKPRTWLVLHPERWQLEACELWSR